MFNIFIENYKQESYQYLTFFRSQNYFLVYNNFQIIKALERVHHFDKFFNCLWNYNFGNEVPSGTA